MRALRLVGLALWSGCASRTLPASYPANGPLSPQAPEAAPAHVTLALHRDPPLPGESTAGWPGLAEGDQGHSPAPDPHAHHHHGGDHAGH